MLKKQVFAVLFGVIPFFVYSCIAAETGKSGDSWQFEITPYIFAAGLDGEIGQSTRFGDVTADIDMGFSDILENLDSGFMGLFEARKDKWVFALVGIGFLI